MIRFLDSLARDARHAARAFGRQPAFAAAAVVTLALGIALNTTVFSAANALALRPLPGRFHDRIVVLSETMPPKFGKWASTLEELAILSPANLADWRRQTRTLDGIAAFTDWASSITGIAEPEQVMGARVSPELFALLGEQPALGRVFGANEQDIVVLSHAFWERRFGSDPRAIGRRIMVNGAPHTVVGVMGADFIFPKGAELWGPLRLTDTQMANRGARWINAIARLRAGATLDEARAEMAAIARRLALQYPKDNEGWGSLVAPADAFYGQRQRGTFALLLASTACVLLIACANVAGLLLARATVRARELAVRVALGATRARLVRHLLAEGAVIAVAGGLLGVLLSLWGVRLFRATLPAELLQLNPGWTRIAIDARALGFTLAVSAASIVLTGLIPAIIASRADPHEALVAGGRGSAAGSARQGARSALVVTELALATVLLVVGSAAGVGFMRLLRSDPGYRPDRALSMEITLPRARYGDGQGRVDSDRVATFFEALAERVRALPGVTDVGFANLLPPSWDDTHISLEPEGTHPEAGMASADPVRLYIVSSNYTRMLGIPLVRGRALSPTDAHNAPAVGLVSESLGRKLWPSVDAVGKRLRMAGQDSNYIEIVGVVGDIEGNRNIGAAPRRPALYLPLSQIAWGTTMTLVARTAGEPELVTSLVRREVGRLDAGVAPGRVLSLSRLFESSLSPQRRTALMIAVFAALSLVLAAIGIYGIVAYAVVQRTNEIGVRMALGASPHDVVRGVMRQGARLVALGVGLGLVCAIGAARGLPWLVQNVGDVRPVLVTTVAAVLAGVALAASYVPARRAARVDPMVALRRD